MKLREAKKEMKRFVKESNIQILEKHKRTFVIKDRPNLKCMRWYVYILVSENHPKKEKLIQEGLQPLPDWLQDKADAWKVWLAENDNRREN
jgi:hypothetical protein